MDYAPQYAPFQMQEIKRQRNQDNFEKIKRSDPKAIVINIPPYQAIISQYGDEFDYGFTSVNQFLKWRINQLGSLDNLAQEMGYGSSERVDFITDLTNYGDDLERFVIDCYNADRIEDL
ncbi:hypothetical protein [Lactobacillus hominis]|uniref:Uncharacterized protein n=1 Tax=Lactobacillus hominis DSM 23910 = CRBIP 24.179 TaxID=1423758 RepID=I7JV09_9LACO|nr:hypothetical protein [Lactobacillus hominis]KRM85776.1 hypothetical protein FC41_GL001091 [Lactobacillus hominis DSM 23910 = CRBIP 24.179]MCT3347178.1 hypothetical protein [Lactobacillus hominis]CCI82016.1 Putative uncharacterized protein [Lactobacillus hominis DSM 23910 = CRBIP 24.179]